MVHVTVYDRYGFYVTYGSFNFMQQAIVFSNKYKSSGYDTKIEQSRTNELKIFGCSRPVPYGQNQVNLLRVSTITILKNSWN